MAAYSFSVIRYVPDPVRGEFVNVGVAVAGRTSRFFGVRFLGAREKGRLRRMGLGRDFRFLDDLAQQMKAQATADDELPIRGGEPEWTAAALERAVSEWPTRSSSRRSAWHSTTGPTR